MTTETMVKLRHAQRRLREATERHKELRDRAVKEIMAEMKSVVNFSPDSFRGVFQRSDNHKWVARIKNNGQTYQIGAYDKIQQAAVARLCAELDITYGETPKTISPRDVNTMAFTALNYDKVRKGAE